jgi:hypothetical protein
MTRHGVFLAGVALFAGVLAVAGCSRRPAERLAEHVEALLDLMEKHHGDPEQAADAVDAYVTEHHEALVALRKEIADTREERSGDRLADFAGAVLKDLGPTMERADRLMRAHPELAQNVRLLRALEPIRAAEPQQ